MSRTVHDATTRHVRLAIQGDSASLHWLVERLTPVLLAHARYRLGAELRTRYDAEDLVNDAWLVALPRLGDLVERQGRYTPVLLRFLSTTLLYRVNELQRRLLRPIGDVSSKESKDYTDTDPAARVAADMTGQITKMVRDETRESVREALDALEERDREILLLRGIEQQSASTVGLLLGLKPSAVSMRYRRALERLRGTLPGSVFDELEDPSDDELAAESEDSADGSADGPAGAGSASGESP